MDTLHNYAQLWNVKKSLSLVADRKIEASPLHVSCIHWFHVTRATPWAYGSPGGGTPSNSGAAVNGPPQKQTILTAFFHKPPAA